MAIIDNISNFFQELFIFKTFFLLLGMFNLPYIFYLGFATSVGDYLVIISNLVG